MAAVGPDMLRLAGRVGREIRKKVPFWRWLFGALNPVSWMWSR